MVLCRCNRIMDTLPCSIVCVIYSINFGCIWKSMSGRHVLKVVECIWTIGKQVPQRRLMCIACWQGSRCSLFCCAGIWKTLISSSIKGNTITCHKAGHIREGRSRVIVWMTHIPIIPIGRCQMITIKLSGLFVAIKLLLIAELTLSTTLGPLVSIITIVIIVIWSVSMIATLVGLFWCWFG